MKKIKYLILLTILLFPLKVMAADDSLTITCTPSSATAGSNVSCSVSASVNHLLGSLSMKPTVSSGLSIVSFERDAVWPMGELSNKGLSVLNSSSFAAGTYNIGILNIKVDDSATIGDKTITFTDIEFNDDENDRTYEVANVTSTITVVENQVTPPTPSTHYLSSLSSTTSNISPMFNKTESGYSLIIPATATTFNLVATAETTGDTITFKNRDTGATLDASNITFVTDTGKSGMMIDIYVGDVDDTPEYSVAVTKDVPANTNTNELSSLKVGDQTVTLVSGKHDYVVELSDVSSYTVVADLNDRTNFRITNLVSPRTGEGTFTFDIEPVDNASGLTGVTYTIQVKKIGGGSTPTSKTTKTAAPSNNPNTGGVTSVLMALVLVVSFGASIYFYKRNMKYFSNSK